MRVSCHNGTVYTQDIWKEMTERITSRLNHTFGNKSNSLRTVVPQFVVKKMGC